MRTTLAIGDDILAAAKHLAARERKSAGEVISALARQALARDANLYPGDRNGLPLLPTNESARPVTLELVNQLRDESQ
jgi:hypothetical protein